MKKKAFRINKYGDMNHARPLAMFAVVIGIMLMSLWLYLLINNEIPGYQYLPAESGFHLAVELCTSLMLLISGIRVLFSDGHGEGMLLLSMGMLFYTIVNNTGYFIEKAGNSLYILNLFLLAPAIYFTVRAFHGNPGKTNQ